MFGKCNLLWHYIMRLSIALVNISICETHTIPQAEAGSLNYGYYICAFMSCTSAYRRHPGLVSLNLFTCSIKTYLML
jgi:hypothetical protein